MIARITPVELRFRITTARPQLTFAVAIVGDWAEASDG
jgi:hypothetical protein